MTASDETARKSSRRLAGEILLKVDNRKAYADVLLDQALRSAELSPSDRALLTELTYGTLRWRGAIDARLSRHLRRPLAETEPRIRNLLRLTCYQLVYLDRIPPYAAVNEAVESAKSYGGRKAAGFVNGVLRSFLREEQIGGAISGADSVAALAFQHSHPEWLVRRWLGEFGAKESAALMRANNERAPLALRVNSLKCGRDQLLHRLSENGIEAKTAPVSPHGVLLPPAGAVENLPGFAAGLFQVQGEASQLVVQLLAPRPGERILDACAAPGGKSTYIAELHARSRRNHRHRYYPRAVLIESGKMPAAWDCNRSKPSMPMQARPAISATPPTIAFSSTRPAAVLGTLRGPSRNQVAAR